MVVVCIYIFSLVKDACISYNEYDILINYAYRCIQKIKILFILVILFWYLCKSKLIRAFVCVIKINFDTICTRNEIYEKLLHAINARISLYQILVVNRDVCSPTVTEERHNGCSPARSFEHLDLHNFVHTATSTLATGILDTVMYGSQHPTWKKGFCNAVK